MSEKDWADEIAEDGLPCTQGCWIGALYHLTECPAFYRKVVAAALRDRDALARDEAVGQFQNAIRDELIRRYKLDADSIDGAGSDSDELDFTMAEIGQAISELDERARVEGYTKGIEDAARIAETVKVISDIERHYLHPLQIAKRIRALAPKEQTE